MNKYLMKEKDLNPLLSSKNDTRLYQEVSKFRILFDLKFKLGLIQNQLLQKKFMLLNIILKPKNGSAINRLKTVISDYQETLIEEALHD